MTTDDLRAGLDEFVRTMNEVDRWYDRSGRPIGFDGYLRKQQEDPWYRYIDETWTLDGVVRVSTIWLGFDHSFWGGPPILFETMVFGDFDRFPAPVLAEARYRTEEQARAGHRALADKACQDWWLDLGGRAV